MRLSRVTSPEDSDISPDLIVGNFDAATAEKELTLAFKRGEKGAYQAIHDTYASRVYGVCRRMLLNHEDAEEAAQETFLKVYQALGRFNGQYQLGAWISRIATNVCLDQIRSRTRKPQTTEAFDELVDLNPDAFVDTDPEDIVIRNAESRHVRKVLAKLPPMHRAAVVLRDFEGLPYDEIAKALEITDCQVKALIHRARQNFKKSWAREIAGALVPSALFERLRKLTLFGRDHTATASTRVAEAAAPSMQTVASCATLAQQCGQAFAERVAPVAMAFVMGGTTVGAAAVASERAEVPTPFRSVEAEGDLLGLMADRRSDREALAKPESDLPVRTDGVEEEPPAEQPTGAEPDPEPVSEPEPGPDQGEDDQSGGSPAPDPTPAPGSTTGAPPVVPEPDGFSFDMTTSVGPAGGLCDSCGSTSEQQGWGRGDASGLQRFSQSLAGVSLTDGAASFETEFDHSSEDMTAYSARFTLRTAEGYYFYSATAHLIAQEPTSWGGHRYTFQGTYHLTSRPSRREAVPEDGTLSVTLEFSSSQQRIVATSVSLQEVSG